MAELGAVLGQITPVSSSFVISNRKIFESLDLGNEERSAKLHMWSQMGLPEHGDAPPERVPLTTLSRL